MSYYEDAARGDVTVSFSWDTDMLQGGVSSVYLWDLDEAGAICFNFATRSASGCKSAGLLALFTSSQQIPCFGTSCVSTCESF